MPQVLGEFVAPTSIGSTQISYRRGNDKNHRRGALHPPKIESLLL